MSEKEKIVLDVIFKLLREFPCDVFEGMYEEYDVDFWRVIEDLEDKIRE